MKFHLRYSLTFVALLTVILALLACDFGAQVTSSASQAAPAPSSAPQDTQAAPATLSERGTPDEAKAMLQEAVDHYNTVGRTQALADFTAKVAPFFDRDLYVVCIDASQIETANGGFPQYVGTSANQLKDNAGNPLGVSIWNSASTDTVNSVDYHWVNPVTGKTEPKTLFVQKVGSDACGVGVYNP